jgi:hypothetical protein
MMEVTSKKKYFFYFFMGCILILGAARFVYSISGQSLYAPSYAEHVHLTMIDGNTERKWGPVFIVLMNGAKKLAPDGNQRGIQSYCKSLENFHESCHSYTGLIWRLGLLVAYGLIIYFLFKLISEFKSLLTGNDASKNYFWNCFLIIVALQSTPVIITILVGGGEILTAFFIIGHFYYFLKKKYLASALLIAFGVYFKLHPVVFAFPYFIFSVFSKHHREYFYYLLTVSSIVGFISFFIQGWLHGSLYPFSMILSIVSSVAEKSNGVIPIWSSEFINPTALLNKMFNGFQFANRDEGIAFPLSTRIITYSFTLLFVFGNVFVGFRLSKLENEWENNNQLRVLHLFIFQVIVGFIYLTCSLDIGLPLMILALISIYSPIFLFAATINNIYEINSFQIRCLLIYLIGLSLTGGLLPTSILIRFLPIEWFNNLSGNLISDYEGYYWYQIPLLGLIIIGFVSYYYSRYLLNRMKPV